MPHYQKLYSYLFGKITDAIEALEQSKVELAKDILIKASCEAEDMYIDSDPEEAEYPTKPMPKELFEELLGKCTKHEDYECFAALCEMYPGLDEICTRETEEELMLYDMQQERESDMTLPQWVELELRHKYSSTGHWETGHLEESARQ